MYFISCCQHTLSSEFKVQQNKHTRGVIIRNKNQNQNENYWLSCPIPCFLGLALWSCDWKNWRDVSFMPRCLAPSITDSTVTGVVCSVMGFVCCRWTIFNKQQLQTTQNKCLRQEVSNTLPLPTCGTIKHYLQSAMTYLSVTYQYLLTTEQSELKKTVKPIFYYDNNEMTK